MSYEAPVDSCKDALWELERRLTAPDTSQWRATVREDLAALRDALLAVKPRPHDADDLDELCGDAPRLAHALRRLGVEREHLAARMDILIARCHELPTQTLAGAIRQILTEVRRYRERVGRMLHEAYTVDIGGAEM